MSITKHIREPDLPDVSAGPANRRGLLISFDFVMIPTVIYCGGQSVRILGIDPGIATVGFGVIDAQRGSQKYVTCGVISTPAHTSLSSRLDQIYNDLVSLFDSFRPDAISVEELFFNTNITTGIAVAHGRGVILLAAYRHNIPVYEYTPLQVKQSVVGYGRAEKRQVIDMVQRILHLPAPAKPDDASDALAMAICHARSMTSLLSKNGGEDICSTI